MIKSFNYYFYKHKKILLLLFIINIIYIEKINRVIVIFPNPKSYDNSLIIKEKESCYLYLSQKLNKSITQIESIFLDFPNRFGNQIILLNKAIFYCEILQCKRIILNKNYYWFIRNKIIYSNKKITIEVGEVKYYQNKSKILIDTSDNFFFYEKYIQPEYRMDVIRNEILKNLPKIKVNSKYLYIYVRSGDVFDKSRLVLRGYFQPPYCFYKKILENFKFEKIYIISENKNNPVIDKLLIKYPNIKYNVNSLKKDISILINAYNIVGAFSTFIKIIILINKKLKKFWYFDFQLPHLFSYFFNFEFNHKNIVEFKMEDFYFYDKMFKCNDLQSQLKIIINY